MSVYQSHKQIVPEPEKNQDQLMVIKYDKKGNEIITFEDVDYKKITTANGRVQNWSLDNLMKAGINPDFPIHTGSNSRIEGISDIEEAERIADIIFSQDTTEEDTK